MVADDPESFADLDGHELNGCGHDGEFCTASEALNNAAQGWNQEKAKNTNQTAQPQNQNANEKKDDTHPPPPVPIAQDVNRIVGAFNKTIADMNSKGQRVGKGGLGGLWNNILGTFGIMRKGAETTDRILGCEDQCNQVMVRLNALTTNSGYKFQNVVGHPGPLFLRHVTIDAIPAKDSGAPIIHLDPLNNAVKVDWP